MKVKHKNSEKGNGCISMSLSHWQKEYSKNGKYLNYEFYDVPEILDLYEIDELTGSLTYMLSDFSYVILPKVKQQPRKLTYKKHDPKYLDEYLMPRKVDYLGLSFLIRIKAKIQQIIRPSQNPNTIPFSRFEKWSLLLMTLAVFGPIVIYILSKLNN